MNAERGGDSWFSSLRRISRKAPEAEKGVIGILAFEVASLMSQLLRLWQCLSDIEILKLREEISSSVGIRRLISEDEDYLMNLAFEEVIRNLVCAARSVVRLGRRCADPRYHKLESFFLDPVEHRFEWSGWEYRWKKMDRKVKKMERFAGLMLELTQEEEVLRDCEQTLRRMKSNPHADKLKLFEYQKKVMWHRQEVRKVRDMSPWNRGYDYIVRLLSRSIFTILEKLSYGFVTMNKPIACSPMSHSFSAVIHPSDNDDGLSDRDRNNGPRAPLGPLRGMGCIGGGISLSPESAIDEPMRKTGDIDRVYSRMSFFYLKHAGHAPALQHSLGEAALAVHYANVVVLIEKLFSSPPHLIDPDKRDDLYSMLPASIRSALRARIRADSKTLGSSSVYDAAHAAEWSKLLAHVLEWLAPLAHNTIKWQREQNIEEQHVGSGSVSHVLLVQTLYFADRVKTEAAITELLIGLSYVCGVHRKKHQRISLT